MNNLEYQKNLPKKRMGVGALIFNNKDEILLVKPTYKDHWSYVGGVVDENESPKEALIREIKEEIGLKITRLDFVAVTYYHETKDKTENLQFKFTAGKLSESQIKKIKIDHKEIANFKFFKIKEAESVLSRTSFDRLLECMKAIKNKKAIYVD